jgi:hypothetical protein
MRNTDKKFTLFGLGNQTKLDSTQVNNRFMDQSQFFRSVRDGADGLAHDQQSTFNTSLANLQEQLLRSEKKRPN